MKFLQSMCMSTSDSQRIARLFRFFLPNWYRVLMSSSVRSGFSRNFLKVMPLALKSLIKVHVLTLVRERRLIMS